MVSPILPDLAAFCSEDSVLRQWLSEESHKGESPLAWVREGHCWPSHCRLHPFFPVIVSDPGWTDGRFPGPHAGSLPNRFQPHDVEH